MDGLLTLQRYLSGTLAIRTAVMDFRVFKSRVSANVALSQVNFPRDSSTLSVS